MPRIDTRSAVSALAGAMGQDRPGEDRSDACLSRVALLRSLGLRLSAKFVRLPSSAATHTKKGCVASGPRYGSRQQNGRSRFKWVVEMSHTLAQ